MKVYILPNRVTLVGKSWQIRHKLKQYGKEYTTVQEWITATKSKRLSTSFPLRTIRIRRRRLTYEKRQLGNSDLFVTEMGLGCMSLGTSETEAMRIIDEAIDLGINFLIQRIYMIMD